MVFENSFFLRRSEVMQSNDYAAVFSNLYIANLAIIADDDLTEDPLEPSVADFMANNQEQQLTMRLEEILCPI